MSQGEISKSQQLIFHLEDIVEQCEKVESDSFDWRECLNLHIPTCCDLLEQVGLAARVESFREKAGDLEASYVRFLERRTSIERKTAHLFARNLCLEVKQILEAVRPGLSDSEKGGGPDRSTSDANGPSNEPCSPESSKDPKKEKGGKRGRRPGVNHDDDKLIFEAWNTEQHKTYEALGTTRGKNEKGKDIRQAIDRHRKRISK